MDPNKPCWWQYYLLTIALPGLIAAQDHLHVSPGWHLVVELGIVVLWLVAGLLWLRRNSAALEAEDTLKRIEQRAPRSRSVPLRPVQAHYLLAMERYTKRQPR